MKKLRSFSLVVLLILLLNSIQVVGQVKFTEITSRQEMEAMMVLSDSLNLPIYIDIYATWCGPCKLMDRETFTDKAVAVMLNTEFISLKMDGESDYGSFFAYQYQLEGYPSSFIFAPGGELITRLVGFLEPGELLLRLQETKDSYQQLTILEKKNKEGLLEGSEISEYITALIGLGREEEAEAFALDYIAGLKENIPLSPNDIRIIANYVTPGTAIWDRLLKDPVQTRVALDTLYEDFVSSAFYRSVLNAIQENNISYVKRFTDDLSVLTSGTEIDGSLLGDLAYIQFYYYTMELDSLFTYVNEQFKGPRANDDNWLFQVASRIVDIDQQFANPDILNAALGWFNKCLAINEKFEYHFYAGMCHYMLGDMDNSMSNFEKARLLAQDDNEKELIESVFNAISNQ